LGKSVDQIFGENWLDSILSKCDDFVKGFESMTKLEDVDLRKLAMDDKGKPRNLMWFWIV
jgi:hypothetical protein